MIRPIEAFADVAEEYADDVLTGRIAACDWVRRACERQRRDLDRAAEGWDYRFDAHAAGRPCYFLERLPHVKGRWGSPTLELTPWWVWAITCIFGWLRVSDGKRRFRVAYLEVGRKNGKSTILAGIGLYCLALDGEPGADCFSAATKREQAMIVWRTAHQMARRAPGLMEKLGIRPMARQIVQPETGSRFVALDSYGRTQDGHSVHFAAVDEVHAHRDRSMWDVIDTATSSRVQPLVWAITTAGSNRAGVGYELHTYVQRILKGGVHDETFWGAIYSTDPEDDWTDERCWVKANPNLGVSVSITDLRGKAQRAKAVPAARPGFLTKHMNQWVTAGVAWMDMIRFDAAADPGLRIGDFINRPCFVGADLATKRDISSIAWLFELEGVVYCFMRRYVPQEAVESGINDSYAGWVEDGWLTQTPGNVIDLNVIQADILEMARQYPIQEFVYDPYQAGQLASSLTDAGILTVQLRPSVLAYSEPMKHFDALVAEGRFRHQPDPALSWMVGNVVAHRDEKENIYPRKATRESGDKIDDAVAIISALNRLLNAGLAKPSVQIPPDYDMVA